MTNFPALYNTIAPKSITTNVNENVFAQIRMANPTPDTLEFCMLLPVTIEDLLMRMSELPFIYYTGGTFYEKPGTYVQFDSKIHCPRRIFSCWMITGEHSYRVFGS